MSGDKIGQSGNEPTFQAPEPTGARLEVASEETIDERKKRIKEYLSPVTRDIKLRSAAQREGVMAEIAGNTRETEDEKQIDFFIL